MAEKCKCQQHQHQDSSEVLECFFGVLEGILNSGDLPLDAQERFLQMMETTAEKYWPVMCFEICDDLMYICGEELGGAFFLELSRLKSRAYEAAVAVVYAEEPSCDALDELFCMAETEHVRVKEEHAWRFGTQKQPKDHAGTLHVQAKRHSAKCASKRKRNTKIQKALKREEMRVAKFDWTDEEVDRADEESDESLKTDNSDWNYDDYIAEMQFVEAMHRKCCTAFDRALHQHFDADVADGFSRFAEATDVEFVDACLSELVKRVAFELAWEPNAEILIDTELTSKVKMRFGFCGLECPFQITHDMLTEVLECCHEALRSW